MVIQKFNSLIRNKWVWGAFAIVVSVAFCFDDLFTSHEREERSAGDAGLLAGEAVSASEFLSLAEDVRGKHGCALRRVAALGISGMMHGYLPLGPDGRQLAPFRTWRSTTAARAGEALSNEFGFHVPMRWSVAQLCQAVMDGAPEVAGISRIPVARALTINRVSCEPSRCSCCSFRFSC